MPFKSLDLFWTRHPALLYGLSSLLSFVYYLDDLKEALILLLLILLTSGSTLKKTAKRSCIILGLCFSVFFYTAASYHLPDLPVSGMQGTLFFEPASLSLSESHFGKFWIYQGVGRHFYSQEEFHRNEAKNFPVSIRIPLRKNIIRPLADSSYLVDGNLKKSPSGAYSLVLDGLKPWRRVANTSSLAEFRFRMKQKVKKFLTEKIGDYGTAEFLSGIATGQFEDRIMRAEFSKLGLQHLMAISGFHFALVASILIFFFRLLLPQKSTFILLVIMMNIYFFFLGATPSIVRAWIMSLITLSGFLLNKRAYAMNSLGVSFLFILLFDPLLVRTIGFQFSAAVTASILIFYPSVSLNLRKFITIRPLREVRNMGWYDKHCYAALSILREGLALGLAVNIIALPMTLYAFHKFPMLSLIYNLFVPFLVSVAMFCTALASFCNFLLPPLGALLFSLTHSFTHFTLSLIYNAPPSLNVFLHVGESPLVFLITYLTGAFFIGILRYQKLDKERIYLNLI